MTQRLTSYNIYESVTYTSWSSDFALFLEDDFMDEHHTWNDGTI